MKKVLCYLLVGIIGVVSTFSYSSANENTEFEQNGVGNDSSDLEYSIRNVESFDMGDYIVTITDMRSKNSDYTKVFDNDSRAAYKTEFDTQRLSITYKKTGKLLFDSHVSATYRYNGTYAYVQEKQIIHKDAYNGTKYSGSISSTTFEKKGSIAHVNFKVHLSFKVQGVLHEDSWRLSMSCTNKGILSSNIKLL